jgi:hypothetical protein
MGLRARSGARVGASCVGASLLALLASSGPVAAAPKPISGKLSKPGYTVIALAANGKAKAVRASRGKFKLRPPAGRVTLQLRAPNGVYAGPVVIGRSKKRRLAIVGVRAGARLGRIKVGRGYARVSKRVRNRWVDAGRRARARKGVPIGAGRFGRVRSRRVRASVPGDSDLDGVPNPLDIDDDGDLILDDLERQGLPRAAQAPGELFDILTGLSLPLENTANSNAAALTTSQIDAALASSGRLLLRILPGVSPELDCGARPRPGGPPRGLVYCSRGGTGSVVRPGVPGRLPFPDCCDPDDDGFGALTEDPNDPKPTPFFMLSHGARTDQIGTGDLLIERVTSAGVESQFTTALRFVFATIPALVSYSDTAGNAPTVSYPVASPTPGPGGLGTQGNGFPVAAGSDGRIVLTLTFWPPQRRPIPPETGEWTDIGGLTYDTVVQHIGPLPGGTTVQKPCPQGSYSVPPGQPLAPPAPGAPGPGLTDQLGDRPADANDRLTYTLDLTHCLAGLGASFNSGEASIIFGTRAAQPGVGAGASQSVWFKRE